MELRYVRERLTPSASSGVPKNLGGPELYWGFPKIMGTILGVPATRIRVFWSILGVPSFLKATFYILQSL